MKRIYFAPDGVYNFVNINTLKNQNTGKYVLDETEISVVNSTADLLTTKPVSKTKSATLIGFPDYNNKSTTTSASKSSLAADVDYRAITSDSSSTRFM